MTKTMMIVLLLVMLGTLTTLAPAFRPGEKNCGILGKMDP